MSYLFDYQQSATVINRIKQLKPDAKAQWGKMDVSQMLAHCQLPLLVAMGEHKMKRNLFGLLFGKMAKKTVVGDKPYKKGLPTAPSFIIKDHRDFEVEKEKLVHLVQQFTTGGKEGLTPDPHPFFGAMTAEEWDKSQWKHLDHHLQQFGV